MARPRQSVKTGRDNITVIQTQWSFLEFFAGGGMARLGLGDSWRCLFANDIDVQKCASYAENFGAKDLVQADINALSSCDLPGTRTDLAWGSFPCQDLSLAGARAGMKAKRSGAFFGFWQHIEALHEQARPPRMIVLENVTGLLTSNGGRDFGVICASLTSLGYRISALVLDAADFIPQSRPRLFILGFAPTLSPPEISTKQQPNNNTAPHALRAAQEKLPPSIRRHWLWLNPAPTPQRRTKLASLIDWNAREWHDAAQTNALISMMSEMQRDRLEAIKHNGARRVGTAFRRTRTEAGKPVQRIEARFDGIAGCLRTPAGGSSRQIVIAIENGSVRTRLLTPREAAKLMGLPDDYILPQSTTAGLKLCGDGVCIPVVRWLSENVLEPSLKNAENNHRIVAA